MKKILIFHPYLAPYRIDLYNRLSQIFNLQVLLTGSRIEKMSLGFDLELINKQAQFTFSYADKGFYLGRHLLSSIYWKYIYSYRPDVVIAHELGINTLLAICTKYCFNYKLIITIDDSPSMIKKYKIIRKLLQWIVVKNSDVILVVNPEVKDYLENKYTSQTLCRFVYFPIIQDDKIFKKKLVKAKKETERLLLHYSLKNKNVILFVGRLEPSKQPDMLLYAFNLINKNNNVLVFVGEGSMKISLSSYAEKNQLSSNVIFTGRLSGASLYAWYRLADIFILPSKFEPFGAVINEALVAGCRVVTSENVGANCLINKDNGVVFKGDNVQNLSNVIAKHLSMIKKEAKGKIRPNKMPILFEEILNQITENI